MKNNMITRNNPFSLIDPFFDEFFTSESNSRTNLLMKTDIKDVDDHYEFKIEVPDVKKEDILVSLENGYLIVEANQNESHDEKKHGKYIRKERYYGTCKRSYYVGEDVTQEEIKAKLEGGVLKLIVPKKQEDQESKSYIEIK